MLMDDTSNFADVNKKTAGFPAVYLFLYF